MKKSNIYIFFFLLLLSLFAFEVAIIYNIKNYNSDSEIINLENSINMIILILKTYITTLFGLLIGLIILYKMKISYKKQIISLIIFTSSILLCFLFCLGQYIY
jgi:hypothetical protein